jgi:hypothetical protein
MRLLLLLNLFILRGGVYRMIALALMAGVIGLLGLGIWSLKASQPQQRHVVHGIQSPSATLPPRLSR